MRNNAHWIREAQAFASGRFVHDLSPIQAKVLALLLELRAEGRPAETTSGSHGVRKSTLGSLAKRGLVEITTRGPKTTARLR